MALGAGCDGVRLADSVDLELNFLLLEGPSDELHSPYVAGADFSVYTINVSEEEEALLSIDASDATVMQVESRGGGLASMTAVGVGSVDMIVRDETSQEVHRATVEVMQPDEATLAAHGPLLVRRPELQPQRTDELRVLVGGAGTFLVEWFAGDTRLSGHGALTAESDTGVAAIPRRTFLFEDREWVTFRADAPGAHEVRLFANGSLTRTITVIGVTEDEVDDVRLHGMDETNVGEGTPLVVYAQAYGADDVPIYGVEYAWDLDGRAEAGLGDLFRYDYVPGASAELCARHGSLEAITTISATEGYVDSSNSVGCSAGGADPAWMGAPLIALALSLLWVRRRFPRS